MKDNMSSITEQDASESAVKKSYHAPLLKNHGKVKTATKAVTGVNGDDSSPDGVTGDTFYTS